MARPKHSVSELNKEMLGQAVPRLLTSWAKELPRLKWLFAFPYAVFYKILNISSHHQVRLDSVRQDFETLLAPDLDRSEMSPKHLRNLGEGVGAPRSKYLRVEGTPPFASPCSGGRRHAPTYAFAFRLASIRRSNHCCISASNQPTARPPKLTGLGNAPWETRR